jgi:hypothetical protein
MEHNHTCHVSHVSTFLQGATTVLLLSCTTVTSSGCQTLRHCQRKCNIQGLLHQRARSLSRTGTTRAAFYCHMASHSACCQPSTAATLIAASTPPLSQLCLCAESRCSRQATNP